MNSNEKKKGEKAFLVAFTLFLLLLLFISFASAEIMIPEIINTQVSKAENSNNALLEVITDEEATCRYDFVDGEYQDMVFEFDDYGLLHNIFITVPDGKHTYYVRCRDTEGNEMDESALISFAVDSLPPTIKESFISPSGIVDSNYNNQVTGDVVDEIKTIKDFDINPFLMGTGMSIIIGLLLFHFYFKKEDSAKDAGNEQETEEPKHERAKEKDNFHYRLEKAHFVADNLGVEEAFSLYQNLNVELRQTPIGEQEKVIIEDGMNRLYPKIMLLNKIQEGHRHIDAGNTIELGGVLTVMKSLLEQVGEQDFETKLVQHGLKSYQYFKSIAEIDYY